MTFWLAWTPAYGQPLVADLSSHLIAITTGFVGTDLVLFGASDPGADIVVVVRGPDQAMTVRRRGQVAGVWLNVESVTFPKVPSFYAIAATRPLEDILPPTERGRHEIGLDYLRLQPAGRAARYPDMERVFRAALIDARVGVNLFQATVGPVTFAGSRLFRTNIYFPSNVAIGLYTVGVFLVRDNRIQAAQSMPLVVGKVGLSAEVSEFARREPLYYGLLAVFGAGLAGCVAAFMFRQG